MAYADYEFYKNTYLGDAIQESEFEKLSVRASSFLDYYTMGKAKDNADLLELKMACCAIAERYIVIERSIGSGSEKQSETVGSYSVTYRSNAETAASVKAEMAGIAREYLAGTGLLYRGGCRHVCSAHCNGL